MLIFFFLKKVIRIVLLLLLNIGYLKVQRSSRYKKMQGEIKEKRGKTGILGEF